MKSFSLKYKIVIITAIAFFLLHNTEYYWDAYLVGWSMLLFLLLVIVFFVLVIILLYLLVESVKTKFKKRQRNILIIIVTIVLGLTILKPTGLINFDKLEGKDLLIAEREGSANCTSLLKLKARGSFYMRNICFSIEKIEGKYKLSNDTIFFYDISFSREKEFYKYAIIKKSIAPNKHILNDLYLYKNFNDTMPFYLWVTKNELKANSIYK